MRRSYTRAKAFVHVDVSFVGRIVDRGCAGNWTESGKMVDMALPLEHVA